jgi:hypothetical protein
MGFRMELDSETKSIFEKYRQFSTIDSSLIYSRSEILDLEARKQPHRRLSYFLDLRAIFDLVVRNGQRARPAQDELGRQPRRNP